MTKYTQLHVIIELADEDDQIDDVVKLLVKTSSDFYEKLLATAVNQFGVKRAAVEINRIEFDTSDDYIDDDSDDGNNLKVFYRN